MNSSKPLVLGEHTRMLVLTGAGVSAESGVPTFRGAGGLWEGHSVEEVASPGGFRRDPRLVWRFYSLRRAAIGEVAPNPAHRALVALEARLGDRFLLVTQNVDGLHRRAGSARVIELHGNLVTSRCTRCDRPPFPDTTAYADGDLPTCDRCAGHGVESLLRPHVVWFGEWLDPAHLERIARFMDQARELVFLAVGTSGVVYPAADLVHEVRAREGHTVLVNLERPVNVDGFDEVHIGLASEILPRLL